MLALFPKLMHTKSYASIIYQPLVTDPCLTNAMVINNNIISMHGLPHCTMYYRAPPMADGACHPWLTKHRSTCSHISIIIQFLYLSVRACVRMQREVTGSHLTSTESSFSIAGCGRYTDSH